MYRAGYFFAFAFLFLLPLWTAEGASVKKAVARIVSADGVDGLVSFEEVGGEVHVTASIEGLAVGPHGFHVHQNGDIRVLTSLDTLGYHFIYNCELVANNSCENDQTHGFPPSEVRHPGDMGNLQVEEIDQPATYDQILGQEKMSLSDSLKSILGRAVLIHSGNDTGMQPYGNAGGPAATGVIGLANTEEDDDDNTAMGPDVPPVDKLMCVLVGEDIRGEFLLTNKFSEEEMHIQFNISGLSEGSYTVAIHTYGDLTEEDGQSIGDVWESSADIPSAFKLSVSSTQENAGSVAYSDSRDRVESLRTAIGRACALHRGDEEGDILAVGVVGLAHVDAELITTEAENGGTLLSPVALLSAGLLSAPFLLTV